LAGAGAPTRQLHHLPPAGHPPAGSAGGWAAAQFGYGGSRRPAGSVQFIVVQFIVVHFVYGSVRFIVTNFVQDLFLCRSIFGFVLCVWLRCGVYREA